MLTAGKVERRLPGPEAGELLRRYGRRRAVFLVLRALAGGAGSSSACVCLVWGAGLLPWAQGWGVAWLGLLACAAGLGVVGAIVLTRWDWPSPGRLRALLERGESSEAAMHRAMAEGCRRLLEPGSTLWRRRALGGGGVWGWAPAASVAMAMSVWAHGVWAPGQGLAGKGSRVAWGEQGSRGISVLESPGRVLARGELAAVVAELRGGAERGQAVTLETRTEEGVRLWPMRAIAAGRYEARVPALADVTAFRVIAGELCSGLGRFRSALPPRPGRVVVSVEPPGYLGAGGSVSLTQAAESVACLEGSGLRVRAKGLADAVCWLEWIGGSGEVLPIPMTRGVGEEWEGGLTASASGRLRLAVRSRETGLVGRSLEHRVWVRADAPPIAELEASEAGGWRVRARDEVGLARVEIQRRAGDEAWTRWGGMSGGCERGATSFETVLRGDELSGASVGEGGGVQWRALAEDLKGQVGVSGVARVGAAPGSRETGWLALDVSRAGPEAWAELSVRVDHWAGHLLVLEPAEAGAEAGAWMEGVSADGESASDRALRREQALLLMGDASLDLRSRSAGVRARLSQALGLAGSTREALDLGTLGRALDQLDAAWEELNRRCGHALAEHRAGLRPEADDSELRRAFEAAGDCTRRVASQAGHWWSGRAAARAADEAASVRRDAVRLADVESRRSSPSEPESRAAARMLDERMRSLREWLTRLTGELVEDTAGASVGVGPADAALDARGLAQRADELEDRVLSVAAPLGGRHDRAVQELWRNHGPIPRGLRGGEGAEGAMDVGSIPAQAGGGGQTGEGDHMGRLVDAAAALRRSAAWERLAPGGGGAWGGVLEDAAWALLGRRRGEDGALAGAPDGADRFARVVSALRVLECRRLGEALRAHLREVRTHGDPGLWGERGADLRWARHLAGTLRESVDLAGVGEAAQRLAASLSDELGRTAELTPERIEADVALTDELLRVLEGPTEASRRALRDLTPTLPEPLARKGDRGGPAGC